MRGDKKTMTQGMGVVYVLKEFGFSLDDWREMTETDKQIYLKYTEMEHLHKKAVGGGKN